MNNNLDKYYTPEKIVNKCISEFFKTFSNISEVIEPSAGNGSFSLKINNCISYDIEPEHESIIKQDFLKLKIDHKKNRAIIGNPPFGKRNNLSLKFFKKSVEICDMIGFILPISQLNNRDSLYEFDLIKSIDLGHSKYSELPVHCCFNLYKRPENGIPNKKPKLSSNLFKLIRTGESKFKDSDFDFMFVKRGSAGKEIFPEIKRYGDEYKVIVFDKKNVSFVKNKILSFEWSNFKKHQSAANISKNDVYRLFLKND